MAQSVEMRSKTGALSNTDVVQNSGIDVVESSELGESTVLGQIVKEVSEEYGNNGLGRSLFLDVNTEGAWDPNAYSPLNLAYIGDAIYELLIRTMVMAEGRCSVNRMHQKTSSLVQASAQSEMIRLIQEELTEEELAVFKRGRNAKSGTMAKNQSMADYRRATGFEALMGYLYLTGRNDRILELVDLGLHKMKE